MRNTLIPCCAVGTSNPARHVLWRIWGLLALSHQLNTDCGTSPLESFSPTLKNKLVVWHHSTMAGGFGCMPDGLPPLLVLLSELRQNCCSSNQTLWRARAMYSVRQRRPRGGRLSPPLKASEVPGFWERTQLPQVLAELMRVPPTTPTSQPWLHDSRGRHEPVCSTCCVKWPLSHRTVHWPRSN